MTTYLSNTLVFYLPLRLLKYMTLRVIDQLKLNSFNLLLGVLLFSISSYAAAADDFSDAPASYGAPTHTIAGALKLGATAPDSELAAAPNATATGDDTTGADDEDGIASFPTLYTGVTSYSLPLNRISATGTGTLHAWIDFNKDGVFSAAEYKAVAVTSNVLADSLNWSGISVGSVGSTYARFRFTSTTLTDVAGTTPLDERSTMAAADGEVEDYALTIEPVPPIPPFCAPETLVDDGNFTSGTLAAGVWQMPSTSGWIYGNAPYDTPIINAYNYDNEVNTFHNSDQTGGLYDAFNPAGNPTTGIRSVLQESDGATSAIIYRFPRALRPGVFNYAFDLSSRFNHTVFQDQYKVSLYNADTDTITAVLAQDFVDSLPTAAVETPKWKTLNGSVSVPSYGNYYLLFQIDPNLGGQNSDYMIDRIVFAGATCDTMDRADAPLSYGTPVHFLPSSLYLGATVDNDPGSLSPLDGSGDGTDDDGVTSFPWLIAGAITYSIPAANLSATGTGTLYAWIDFNKDGAFSTTEQRSVTVTNGVPSGPLSWTGITVGSIGTTYARLRFTSAALADNVTTITVDERATVSTTDGEVEDYALLIETLQDRGDAPATYGTPTHTLSGSLKLGTNAPDGEGTLSPLNGLGDDTTGTDDEDGISSFPVLTAGATSYSIPGSNITGAGTGMIHAWIDFNKDGAFSANEYASVAATGGIPAGSLVWSGITVGSAGTSYLRLRFTTTALTDNAGTVAVDERATMAAANGEVEDYAVTFIAPTTVNCGTEGAGSGSGYATSGTGLYRDSIFWLDWSCGAVTTFNPGDQVTKTWDLGNGLTISATVNNINVVLKPYVTGTWSGDSLPSMYGGLNPLGLINAVNGEDPDYDVSFTMMLNGTVIPTHIVTAEAEDTGYPNESASWTTNGDAWRVIDRGGNYLNVRFSNANKTLYMEEPADTGGGSIVALSDNVSSVHVSMQAGGYQAPAFGVFIPFDHGDAQGFAADGGHYLTPTGTGGSQPTTLTGFNSLTLSTVSKEPGVYLGSVKSDSEAAAQPNATATGDDTAGTDDEDGVTLPSLTQGASATIPVSINQPSANSGYLQGWIDWNGDGDFADTGEQIATNLQYSAGTSGTINIPVNVPATAVTTQTYARFRWSSTNNLTTTAAAANGEVEDYAVTVAAAFPPISACNAAVYGVSKSVIIGDAFLDRLDGLSPTGYTPVALNNAFPYNEIYNAAKAGDNNLYYVNSVLPAGAAQVYKYDTATNTHSATGWTLPNPGNTYWISAATDPLGRIYFLSGQAKFLVRIDPYANTVTTVWSTVPPTAVPGPGGGVLGGDYADIGFDSAGDAILIDNVRKFLWKVTGVNSGSPTASYMGTLTGGTSPTHSDVVWLTDGGGTPRLYVTGSDGLYHVDTATYGVTLVPGSSKHYYDVAGCAVFGMLGAAADYSDAPASFGAPAHTIAGSLKLGASAPDSEAAALPNATATGDDAAGVDDEDGVTLPSLTQGASATIPVSINQPSANSGYLQGWIDWNGDGDFADAGEQTATNLQYSAGTSGTINIPVNVPVTAVTTQTYARFRWSSTNNLTATAAANDGEVEDYALTIQSSYSLSGQVFEDVNYGGGAGRDITTSAGVGRSGVRVELYDSAGAYLGFTFTNASGDYNFSNLSAGSYTVRVVNSFVTSSRSGACTASTDGVTMAACTQAAVQTYRTNGLTANVGTADPNRVGGENPALIDAAANISNATLASLTTPTTTAQSITAVTLTAAVTGIDFGFNFDTIVNTNDAGQGSLRQFILNSNLLGNTGLDQVDDPTDGASDPAVGVETSIFEIPGVSPFTISPLTALPAITDAYTAVDATTQTGASCTLGGRTLLVNLLGSSAGANTSGLSISAGHISIRGMAVGSFTNSGISANASADNLTVACNNIGLDANGITLRTNTLYGVLVNGADNLLVGGSTTNERNIISGNGRDGLRMEAVNTAVVENNYAGTTASGTAAASNNREGASYSAIGAYLSTTGLIIRNNLVSGNDVIGGVGPIFNVTNGIRIDKTSNVLIIGNLIGTTPDGLSGLGNSGSGIYTITAGSSNITIGGTNTVERNIISRNGNDGIKTNFGTNGITILGNYIGTDINGTGNLGNLNNGIFLADTQSAQVGNGTAAGRNIIAGNSISGTRASNAPSALIRGNYIGVDVSGMVGLRNNQHGIYIQNSTNVQIGGGTIGDRNIIANNGVIGVFMTGVTSNTLVENNIVGLLADGDTAKGNVQSGVETSATDGVVIRNNIISANGTRGVHLVNSPNTTLTGNTIGLNEAGTADRGNTTHGVDVNVAAANLLVNNNTISGNNNTGVYIHTGTGTANIVKGNRIGVAADGITAMGNSAAGVRIETVAGIMVGGTAAGETNTIAYNGNDGIQIFGANAKNNVVSHNSIYANTGLGIDLDDNGVTLNDGGDGDSGYGNDGFNFPQFTRVQVVGSDLILAGCAPAGSTIELFEADVSPTVVSPVTAGSNQFGKTQDYGEGEIFLTALVEGVGEDIVTSPVDCATLLDADGNNASGMNPFQWTFALPSDVVLGDKLTATATVTGTGTSEFSAIATVSNSYSLSGVVFEDINYGGGAGRTQATATGIGINGAKLELYSSTGALVSTTTTANDGTKDGAYTFSNLVNDNYYIRVVSDSVNSTRTGSTGTELAVQTFRTDGTTAVTNEVGGRNPTLADGVANTGTETLNTTTFKLSNGSHVQSLQAVTLATTDVTGVDFGFNFDTIVNTNDTGQGSLRQFILNSNLLGGEASLAQAGSRKRLDNTNEPLPMAYESSIFMIPSSTLTAGIAKIQIASSASLLPSVTGTNTILDATTQTTNIGDTNTGLLGTGGTVGVDALTLAKIPAPEVELFPATAGYTYGMHLNNTGVVVRGFSAYGFGSDVNANGVIVVGSSGNGVIIEQNVLGTTASSFTAPALRGQGSTIQTGASGGFVLNNLIGFSGANGLRMNGNTWTVKANEIRGNGAGSADGLWGYFGSNMTIEGNLITDSASGGYDGLYRSSFTNNTVTYNGRDTSSTEDYGVSVVGDGSLINRNIFTNNTGQGVLVYNNVHPTTLDNWVSQNSMFANGKLGIDLVSTAGNTAGDNVSINDANDSDTGANRLLNFPQIREAHLNAGMLTLRGCASAGAIIELFEADVSPTSSSGVSAGANQLGRTQDYGEGERYLLTLTEGVGEETTSNPVNCTNLTDSDNNNATGMNPFQWTIPLPTGLVLGDVLTATATLSGSGTSEFSAATLVSQPLDYSDAPASYGNPAHLIVNGIHLGALAADNETSAMPTANADGDDTTGSDDEDGVTLPTAFTANQITSISVAVVGSGGQLQAWIDWNGDGDFSDTGEKIANNLADNTGIDTDATVGTITFNVTPPATAVNGNTYARFRWSTQSNLNSTLAANDGEVEDYAVQVVAGGTPLSIAGRVFNDLNVNGIDDNEAGLKDVVIVLENLTTGTCSSVKTAADGSYHFDDLTAGDYTVIEAVGAKLPSPTTCPPTAKDPNGFVSSTPNSLAITLASAAVNDADFGEVKAPLFSLDHSKVILPNSSINYPHTFQTYADGNVLFNITQEVADPNDLNWSTSLFLDTNCDAKLDQGDTPITSALAVSAGTKLCILAKVIAPANAPAGALHVLTVSSDFQYGDASLITTSNIQTHTDHTQTSAETTPSSGEGKLSLEKSVWNVTRNIDGNVALPGETLQYTIYYENIGNGLLSELIVQDSVPEFTQLVPNSLLCDNTPPELTNCTPQVSGIGLEWVFLGQLKAGSKGQVSYQVIVE